MKYFEDLGDRILRDWLKADGDARCLHEIAGAHLSARPPCCHVSVDDIVKWAIETQRLPFQPDLDSNFGQPPLTVYWHPGFYIEVLFWMNGTTSVHQHAFSGAFSVVEGSSLQSCYRFSRQVHVNEHLILGDIALDHVKVLRPGSVEPIQAGPTLIHGVFHLEVPSVTVVVRTVRDECSRPQYEYHWPYVAADPFYKDPATTRRVQLLDLLNRMKSPRYVAAAKAALDASDFWGVLQILWAARSHLQQDSASFDELITAATTVHGSRVRAVHAVIEERVRIDIITSRRAASSDPDHRFLLALLLNLRDRAAILRAITNWCETDDPCALLMRWVVQLSGTSTVGVEFDELNTFVFEQLLRGVTIPDILADVEALYSHEEVQRQRQELIRHCESMQSSQMFRSLLDPTEVPLLLDLLANTGDVNTPLRSTVQASSL